MLKRRMLAISAMCAALLTVHTTCAVPNGAPPPPYLGIQPDDRDVYLVSYPSTINWGASNTGPEIKIELFRDGLGGPSEVIGIFPADQDSQPWMPTGPTSVNCVFKATDTLYPSVTAVSGVFRIVGPGLYAQGPHLIYAVTTRGDNIVIDWHDEAASQAGITDVRIELTRDGGITWEEIAASVPAAGLGYYAWTVTDGGLPLPQPDCQFRVSDVGNPSISDVSLPFSIE